MDHPRSRGVYKPTCAPNRNATGSSPLARGLLTIYSHRLSSIRIIPARAGFTPVAGALAPSEQDHPRSRGVYEQPINDTFIDAGSSPLARGLPTPHLRQGAQAGIIPARAGFTSIRPGKTKRPADHPRSRGVYRMGGCIGDEDGGSSPLARGLPARPLECPSSKRIIPARAGFTSGRRRHDS